MENLDLARFKVLKNLYWTIFSISCIITCTKLLVSYKDGCPLAIDLV